VGALRAVRRGIADREGLARVGYRRARLSADARDEGLWRAIRFRAYLVADLARSLDSDLPVGGDNW
jgi:hypothetical protein